MASFQKSLNSHPLTMYCFRGRTQKCTKLFFYRHLGSMPLFNHTHVVNGVIIVHSHINTGEHTHSKQSLETIFFLSNILAFGDFQSSFIPVPCSFPIRVPPLVPALSDMTTISRGGFSLYCCPLKVGKQWYGSWIYDLQAIKPGWHLAFSAVRGKFVFVTCI